MNSELASAAERGDLSAVERLLEEGASVENRDDSGRTALVAAAYENHLEVARKLIEAGADVRKEIEASKERLLASLQATREARRRALAGGIPGDEEGPGVLGHKD